MSLCNICFDQDSTLLKVSVHEANPCANFSCCEQCAFTYISNKIKEKDVSDTSLTCPSGCKASLTPGDVHRVLNSLQSVLASEVKSQLNLYEQAKLEQNKVEEERNRRLQRVFPSFKDLASDIALGCWSFGADSGRCPGCRTLIEKNGGCQHMTCRNCKHQWWWCCGQDYRKGSHNEVLCFPMVYVSHRHKLWGPNVLVRTVTKTAVAGVGIGLGAVAVSVASVAVPTYFAVKAIDKYSGIREKRHRSRRQRRERERVRRAVRAREERLKRLEEEANEERRKLDVAIYGFDSDQFMHPDTKPGFYVSVRYYQVHRVTYSTVMNELIGTRDIRNFDRAVNQSLNKPIM